MAAYPAMPLYTDAYLADTRHLNTEEHGAYLLLLMCAWRAKGCALKDDDRSLARITGLSPTRWRRMRPSLAAFFDISGGFWRHGKLNRVYDDVAARVARNRLSGAKGGKARAARLRAGEAGVLGQGDTQPSSTRQATKTKAAAASDSLDLDSVDVLAARWRAAIHEIAGPDLVMDAGTLQSWVDAGVDLAQVIVPTIRRLIERERKRTGQSPKRLAYFKEAVLEAHACTPVPALPQAEKQLFDPSNASHWRQLLGDEKSPFRGDYMARNWFIPREHPEFQERSLGPNPRFETNPIIPSEVIQVYGRAWHWR